MATNVDLTAAGLKNYWLFELTLSDGTTYDWSTQTIDIEIDIGEEEPTKITYTGMVLPETFNGIKINNGGDTRIHRIEDFDVEIPNSDGSFTDSDFIGATVDIREVFDDGTNVETVRIFPMQVKNAKTVYGIMELTFTDRWFTGRNIQPYPRTDYIADFFPANRQAQNSMTPPVPFGTPYIPCRPVFTTDYDVAGDGITGVWAYVLGENTSTYSITECRSPRDSGAESTWGSEYVFTQISSTEGPQLVFPKISDTDDDDIDDYALYWQSGDVYMDMPIKYSRADTDTYITPPDVEAYVMIYGTIPLTVTYTDPITGEDATTVISGWAGMEVNGAFYVKKERNKHLTVLLNECNSFLTLNFATEDRVWSVFKKDAKKTAGESNIVEQTFRRRIVENDDNYDGAYVAHCRSGEPQDVLYKTAIPLYEGGTPENPSDDTLELPHISDSVAGQTLGQLWAQRKYGVNEKLSFTGEAEWNEMNPDYAIDFDVSEKYGVNKKINPDMTSNTAPSGEVFSPGGETDAYLAMDGDDSTYFATDFSTLDIIGYDFGANTFIKECVIKVSGDAGSYDLDNANLYGSYDNIDYTFISASGQLTAPINTFDTELIFNVDRGVDYRYYKFKFQATTTDSSTFINVYEMRFYEYISRVVIQDMRFRKDGFVDINADLYAHGLSNFEDLAFTAVDPDTQDAANVSQSMVAGPKSTTTTSGDAPNRKVGHSYLDGIGAYGTDGLELTDKDGKGMLVHDGGIVTNEYQPRFVATLSADFTIDTVSVYLTVPFDGVQWTDNEFDTTNNEFVAPVAGYYRFELFLRIDLIRTDTDYYGAAISTTSRIYRQICRTDDIINTTVRYWTFSVSCITYMDEGDTAEAQVVQYSGTANDSHVDAGTWTWFSGSLLF